MGLLKVTTYENLRNISMFQIDVKCHNKLTVWTLSSLPLLGNKYGDEGLTRDTLVSMSVGLGEKEENRERTLAVGDREAHGGRSPTKTFEVRRKKKKGS